MKRLFLFLFIFSGFFSIAQPPPDHQWIEIIVTPNHTDWTYKIGEDADFQVTVLKSNVPMPNVTIHYVLGEEQMKPEVEQDVFLENGSILIKGGSMAKPGFKRCLVSVELNGKTYSAWATAGFEPDKIEPTVKLPFDFQTFWSKAVKENRELPMDARMILLPERSTEKVNVYEVSLQNWKNGARLYGILSVPKKAGKYPAVLKVPGAGIRPYYGDVQFAEDGIISFEIGIHGISVTMPQKNYDDLLAGWNNHYWEDGIHDKDEYFYKRVYLGCVKANDFLCSLPQWDGKNLGVMGSSQGGALSLVTAGIDARVTAVAPVHPAMCDMTGYLEGRAGGWPHYLRDQTKWEWGSHDQIVETISYYDALNFARSIQAPVWFSFGYNDNVVPPTSIFAAYNVIKSKKEKFLALESAHWVYPEQQKAQRDWMTKMLKKKNPAE
ncbi:acetylxylan esterase [Jiulongibacter sediminis]|jgi:cephalosporin-C deacetylase-like acetyl esterase|uniref:acetylxylan esterase n=1 Tax=Jiulongibacter sediminis TaxID=1605367 RepID=UPI0026EE31BC|nr:acetylxylan esterase [Jiulongibacter sediminis]